MLDVPQSLKRQEARFDADLSGKVNSQKSTINRLESCQGSRDSAGHFHGRSFVLLDLPRKECEMVFPKLEFVRLKNSVSRHRAPTS